MEQVSQLTANRLREKRLLDLTGSEISELPGEAHMYRGVGKMYVDLRISRRLMSRFVLTEKSAVLEEIAAEKATTDKALEGLSKRREYLETTLNNARSHIDAATQRAS